MHLKRWITSIVALPFLILLLCKGGAFLFAIIVSLVSLVALWEYFGIVFNDTGRSLPAVVLLPGYTAGAAVVLVTFWNLSDLVIILIAFNLIFSGILSIGLYKLHGSIIEVLAKQILGFIYIPVSLSYLVMVRNCDDGVAWIFFVLFLVFLGDTTAFYTGTYFGRHKLCPNVSPGKTIEGSAGGLVSNIIVGFLFKNYFLPHLSWSWCILFFICIGIAGQAGDLFESFLKRTANMKDSGTILPGHGGILDRIDALIFAAPVAYVFKEYIF